MANPYRADQVGSLLRPPDVLDAHAAHAQGRMSLEELRRIEDSAILRALAAQKQAGIDVFSDGEYRRGSWAGEFSEAVDGYVPGAPPIPIQFKNMPEAGGAAPSAGPAGGRVIGGTLRQKRRLTAHEASFLKQHAVGPFKITMPAPSYVVARGYKPGVSDRAYPRRTDALRDAAAIVRAEVQALVAEGVPYVQLDNPHYPDYVDESRRREMQAIGIDPDQALADDIAADNACLQGVDRGAVTLAMHLCRGNARSGWHTSGGYDRIAEQVFGAIDVDRFLLEYDSDRAGGFEPLRFMPKSKLVVLGLITTKSGVLESQADLLRRIEEASKYVPLENLALSPQCGFASTIQGNLLSWDEQQQKLQLVAATARRVWG